MKRYLKVFCFLLTIVIIMSAFAGCEPGKDGKDGKDGASWTTGITVPDNANGKDGDLYMDTMTWDIYLKISGVWEKSGNLKGRDGAQGLPGENGKDGTDGAAWIAGGTDPDSASGKDGDFYINTVTFDIYLKKTGEWEKTGNIKGGQGEAGKDGEAGLSAYEIYLKYYPDYEGDEKQWINDIASGKLARYTVTFDGLGGNEMEPVVSLAGQKIAEPKIPEKAGYIFMGWYKESGYAVRWEFTIDIVERDITLYAKWKASEYYTPGLAFGLIDNGMAYEVSKGKADVRGTVVIPAEYAYGLPVTRITAGGFYGYFDRCAGMKKVILPDSITSIGNSAFEDCKDLIEVIMPGNLKNMGSSVFKNCLSLTTINLPDSLITIGREAFSYCRSLKTIKIPAGVQKIEEKTFYGCYSLTTINLPEGLNAIEREAFCDSGLETIKIPADVQKIEEGTFDGCSSLTTINLPDGLYEIGSWAFVHCASLKTIKIPASVRSIGESAFGFCEDLSVFIESIYPYQLYINNSFHYTDVEEWIDGFVKAIYVPDDAFKNYQIDFNWERYWYILFRMSQYHE